MTTETYPHIETSQDDVPMIAGTNTKVVEVVLDRKARHWDVDEIQRQHPHLKPAQEPTSHSCGRIRYCLYERCGACRRLR
jgi:hypothetical protein